MKKLGLLFVMLLSLAALSLMYFGASMLAQGEDNLLLFSYYNDDTDSRNLYLLNANSGEERFITELSGAADAGWSPDGRIWVVDDEDSERRLRFLDAETGEESIFEHPLYLDSCAANVFWSPNGEQMAYISNTSEEFFLNLQNQTDGSSYQIPIEPYWDETLWSPDSQYLLLYHSRLYLASDGSPVYSRDYLGSFSPDSRYISYWDAERSTYLYEIATGESIRIGDGSYSWSRDTRYLMSSTEESLILFDSQNENLQTFDLGFRFSFAGWAGNENTIFLRTDFVQYEGFERGYATKLLLYELESQTSTVILENTAWLDGIYRNGNWFAIGYSTIPPEDQHSQPNRMLFYDGTSRIDSELALADTWIWPNVSGVGDGLGFVFYAEDGLYYFDNASASLELIATDNSYQFVSPDGDSIAFLGPDENGDWNNLSIWQREDRIIHIAEQDANQIIGWQGSKERYSLLYCGEG